MNKIIRKGVLLGMTVLVSGLVACSQPTEESKTPVEPTPNEPTVETQVTLPTNLLDKWTEVDCFSYSYKQLGKDVMPIGAWSAPTGEFNTNEQYKYLKEAGLNSIYGLHDSIGFNSPEVFKALDYAQNNGIVYLVRDTGIAVQAEDDEVFQEYIKKYTEHPAYGGTLLVDEPGVKQFANYVAVRKMFRKYLPKDAFYINLLPNYASQGQLENGAGGGPNTMNLTYDQYIESFLKTIQPQFLSYDYYGTNKEFPHVDKGYLEQIYINAKYAHQYKIPFWPFIQACEYGGSTRVPNDVDIYWQVNVSLAYGAKGIQYFCYFQPPEFTEAGYQGSFIDGNGNKTSVYYSAQKINNQIAKMDHILMNSTLMCQMAIGDSPCKIEQDNLVTAFREIASVTTEDDLLVGCFDYGGKSVFYFVNNNLTEDCNATINFTDYVEASLYYMAKDELANGQSISISLEPGQGVLVEITNYK